MDGIAVRDEWEILLRFLPEGWEEMARKFGALTRKRKIKSAEVLLRILLIHLADGKSLRTTVAYAAQAGLCHINDVALLHRLRVSAEWLRWMSMELVKTLRGPCLPTGLARKFRTRLVDASVVTEPGSKTADWRIHYCLQLNTLRCDSFQITTCKKGENLQRFEVKQGDLMIGDRAYCKRRGITYVLRHEGQVLVRFHSNNLPLFSRQAKPVKVLPFLRSLDNGEAGDKDVWFKAGDDESLLKGRLCSIRKSKEAIRTAKKALRRRASRTGQKLKPETLEFAEYVVLFTSVNRHHFKANDILALYRGRWQIELVFKRLKSIVGIGFLPKHEPDSCKAWLYGKMLVALLAEHMYQAAEFISPWGYPLRTSVGGGDSRGQESMAGV